MDTFTPETEALLQKMRAAGWDVYYQMGGACDFTGWYFAKMVKTKEYGDFWRIGKDADLKAAADKALAHERGKRSPK